MPNALALLIAAVTELEAAALPAAQLGWHATAALQRVMEARLHVLGAPVALAPDAAVLLEAVRRCCGAWLVAHDGARAQPERPVLRRGVEEMTRHLWQHLADLRRRLQRLPAAG